MFRSHVVIINRTASKTCPMHLSTAHHNGPPVRDSQGRLSLPRFPYSINHQRHHSQQSFANVPITADGVETFSFLEAADGLMDLFGKYPGTATAPLSQPLPPIIKIFWAAPSLLLSRRTSEITLPYVYPRRPFHFSVLRPRPVLLFTFFGLVSNALHFRGSALGTMLTNPRQKRSRASFGLRRGRAGCRAQHVWSA